MDLKWMLLTVKQKSLDLQRSLSLFLIRYIIEASVLERATHNQLEVLNQERKLEVRVSKERCPLPSGDTLVSTPS